MAQGQSRKPLYWHFPGYLGGGKDAWRTTPAGAIRVGDWKLVEFFETGKIELYNLKDDIGEKNDLSEKMPDKVKELKDDWDKWSAAQMKPLWVPAKKKDKNEE